LDLVSTRSQTRWLIRTSIRPSLWRLHLSGNDAPLLKMMHSSPRGIIRFNSYVILSGTVRAVDVSTGERVVFVRYGAGYLFPEQADIVERIREHPALLWKAGNVAEHLSKSKNRS
jgi:hypothetical protein